MAEAVVLESEYVIAGVWPVLPTFGGPTILGGGSSSSGETPVEPSFYAWVRGSITKFQEPLELNVIAVSLTGETLGMAVSDSVTGEYEIDVAPHTKEVLVLAAQDYGISFAPGFNMAAGQYIHPTIPNRRIYRAKNAGALGGTEPNWPLVGEFTSGGVVLEVVKLFEPLAGGYLKPAIEAK